MTPIDNQPHSKKRNSKSKAVRAYHKLKKPRKKQAGSVTHTVGEFGPVSVGTMPYKNFNWKKLIPLIVFVVILGGYLTGKTLDTVGPSNVNVPKTNHGAVANDTVSNKVTAGNPASPKTSKPGVTLPPKVALPSNAAQVSNANSYGVDQDANFWTISQAETDRYLDKVKASNAHWFRISAPWWLIEKQNQVYDWARMDAIVQAAGSRGIKLLVVTTVNQAPQWATADGKLTPGAPARDPAYYGDYIGAMVGRYKNSGVKYWEMGNEPNLINRWVINQVGQPNPADYTRYLKAGYLSAKKADSEAFILTAGMGDNPAWGGSIDGPTFIKGIYAAGGKGYFDAISYHPYDFDTEEGHGGWDEMVQVRAMMVSNGDSNKKVWATEYGVADKADDVNYQPTMLVHAYARLASYDWTGPMLWFSFRNSSLTGASSRFNNYGLVDANFNEKPAFVVFKNAAGGF